MSELFRRSWKVQVDTLDVSALDLEFKILTTIKPFPNKCVLTLWNLNADHRAQILKRNRPSEKKIQGVPVQVEAGYINNTAVLFRGDLREAVSQRDPTDWKTVMSGDDGGVAYRESRINRTFTKGTPIASIVKECAGALDIGTGNVDKFISDVEIGGVGKTLPHTMTLSGPASRELSRVLESVKLSWSIQRGVLQVQKKGQPLDLGAIRITPDTGLVGSPEASIDATVALGNPQQFAVGAKQVKQKKAKAKDPSILKLRTLLIPGLVPGRKIALESAEFNGGYMLTEVEYVGQSWTPDVWHCQCVARVY